MPKRMLDDSLLTSRSLAKCSARAQDAFPRFILMADDFGCFEVIPRALAARGWVYRNDVVEADIIAWLEEYVAAGMACLWTENERRYCYLLGWDGPHGQRKRVEYDPSAPKGTPGAHGSKRKTPRPPADLVEAVRLGLRRDRDGRPPGVASPSHGPGSATSQGGPAAGESEFPPGKGAGGIPCDSPPARETAGDARERRGSAAPAAVPVPVPAAAAAGSRLPAGREEARARLAPETQRVLEGLAEAGWSLTSPGADRRARFEAATTEAGVEATLAHVRADLEARVARRQEVPSSLGFYLGDVVTLARRVAAGRDEPARPRVPVLDLAWLAQVTPAERRAEAEAAWAAKQAEVEASFRPDAVPRVLASAAEEVRERFLGRSGGATR